VMTAALPSRSGEPGVGSRSGADLDVTGGV